MQCVIGEGDGSYLLFCRMAIDTKIGQPGFYTGKVGIEPWAGLRIGSGVLIEQLHIT